MSRTQWTKAEMKKSKAMKRKPIAFNYAGKSPRFVTAFGGKPERLSLPALRRLKKLLTVGKYPTRKYRDEKGSEYWILQLSRAGITPQAKKKARRMGFKIFPSFAPITIPSETKNPPKTYAVNFGWNRKDLLK
jgi:hypothetical protein